VSANISVRLIPLDIMSLQDYFTQTLKKDEAVVAIIRKHWITLAGPIITTLIVVGILIGFVDYFFAAVWSLVVWLVLLGVILLYLAHRWVIHFFDSFIITDLRIIDIDQKGLFKRVVSETTFDKVQDVTYSIIGIVATSFNYGSVNVQTGGAEGKIELDHVPHPRKVQEIILEAQRLFKERHGGDMTAQQLLDIITRVKETGKAGPADEIEAEEAGAEMEETEEIVEGETVETTESDDESTE
jgi:hypothetical protein